MTVFSVHKVQAAIQSVTYSSFNREFPSPLRLNLGSCDRTFPGFVSVDLCPPADIIMDLGVDPWMFEDSSVEEVRAYDVLEHLADRIATMNNLHRILRPGGRADIIVPSATHGAGFAQDPTHKSAWSLNSFQYYEHGSFAQKRLAQHYGITASFRIVSLDETRHMDVREEVWKIHAVLEAVKS